MVSRREFLRGLGASAAAVALLPGCGTPIVIKTSPQPRGSTAAWARAAVDALAQRTSAAWCNVVRIDQSEFVIDVIGETQTHDHRWQLELGVVRTDGTSDIRTLNAIEPATIEATVANLLGVARWQLPAGAPSLSDAQPALQVQATPVPPTPWRQALQGIAAGLQKQLHSRIIYNAAALRLIREELWSYRRSAGSSKGDERNDSVVRQHWQCTVATRLRDALQFATLQRGSSIAEPTPGIAAADLSDLMQTALRHETPSEPERKAIALMLPPTFAASVLTAVAAAGATMQRARVVPQQPNAYARTFTGPQGLAAQTAPLTNALTNAQTGAAMAHIDVAAGSAELTALREKNATLYLLEPGAIVIDGLGGVTLWPAWAVEMVRGVTSGRAYRGPVVRTTVAAVLAAEASTERSDVVFPAPNPAPGATWSATVPWLVLNGEFA